MLKKTKKYDKIQKEAGENLVKKMICALLCILIAFSFSFAVTAESPVIKGISNGQTINGDTEIYWEEISSAEYYTVNVRYIQNGDGGPLAYDAVKTQSASFTLEKKVMDSFGYGAYRVCIGACINGKMNYSPVVVYTYTDVVSPISGKTAVCFGDSLTANGVWEKILSARFGASFINAGVGGTTTETSLERFKTEVLAENPDITLICFAYNDAVKIDRKASRVSLERYRENLEYYVNSLKQAGSEVILFSPNPVIEEYFNENPLHPGEDYIKDGGINALVSKYTDIMAEVAKKYGVYYFDLASEFEKEDIYSLMNTDGVHPNTKGYTLYAKALGDFIQSIYSKNAVTGDINGNGKVDTADYLMCRRMMLGNMTPTAVQKASADVNRNGVIDANDYVRIKRIYLGSYTVKE